MSSGIVVSTDEGTIEAMQTIPLEHDCGGSMVEYEYHSPTEAECIEELEKCSLKDNEKCNCVWQMFRASHGIFHWMNSISCVRRRKRKATGTNGEEDSTTKEGRDIADFATPTTDEETYASVPL